MSEIRIGKQYLGLDKSQRTDQNVSDVFNMWKLSRMHSYLFANLFLKKKCEPVLILILSSCHPLSGLETIT